MPEYIFNKFYSGLECRAVTPRGLAATASTRTERSEGEGLPGRPQESIRSERKDTDSGNRSFIHTLSLSVLKVLFQCSQQGDEEIEAVPPESVRCNGKQLQVFYLKNILT